MSLASNDFGTVGRANAMEVILQAKGCFITGTDTGIGKTWVTLSLIRYFKERNYAVAGMKPVATGAEYTNNQLKNDDAVMLQKHSSVEIEYDLINPYCFKPPISPNLAARQANIPIDFNVILSAYQSLSSQVEVVIVEGVGGWLVPLNEAESISDLAKYLTLPVVMVVGVRLGCINHARLTLAAIEQNGCFCCGWVANILDPSFCAADETLKYLQEVLTVQLIGTVAYQSVVID